jgi:ATP-binding cassette subfamily B protein
VFPGPAGVVCCNGDHEFKNGHRKPETIRCLCGLFQRVESKFIRAPILVFIIGTLRVIDGHTSIGTVVAISSLMIYLFLPLQEIALARIKMQKPKAMWEKISDLLNEQEEDLSGQMTNELTVNMEDIQFAYDSQNHIFENMNIHVKSGESIAIVGKTGSGKSTLYKLLAKFYPTEKGQF